MASCFIINRRKKNALCIALLGLLKIVGGCAAEHYYSAVKTTATSSAPPTLSRQSRTAAATAPSKLSSKHQIANLLHDLQRLTELQQLWNQTSGSHNDNTRTTPSSELPRCCPVILTPTHSRRDSSYTKLWRNADWENYQETCWHRYQSHIRSWVHSPTAISILPTVLLITMWATIVTIFLSSKSMTGISAWISSLSTVVPTATTLTAPIALLLTLRTNRALDRLLEARRQFGAMARVVTSLAGMVGMYIIPSSQYGSTETNGMESVAYRANLMGRYLAIFGWCVKGYFRNEDDTQVLLEVLPSEEVEWLKSVTATDRPLCVIYRLRSLLVGLDLPLSVQLVMEERLGELDTALGTCKRILASPIPPTYTRHLSRILCLYLGFLPFNCANQNAVLTSTLTSYVTLGLDEIAVEVEHPFPLIPMLNICRGMQNNVYDMLSVGMRSPPIVECHLRHEHN